MVTRRSAKVYVPEVGALVRDRLTKRIGVYMGSHAGNYYLRPQGGGCEWRVFPSEAEPGPVQARKPADPNLGLKFMRAER